MFYGFKFLVEVFRKMRKEVIVCFNLIIYFEMGFGDIFVYCVQYQLRVVVLLFCYFEDNVDKMCGNGVYEKLIKVF